MTPLFDTNVLIDALNKLPAALFEIESNETIAISVMTWMEVMVGAAPHLEASTRQFLDEFDLVDMNPEIMERAVDLRRQHRIKLVDAVIWATAQVHGMLLITRNTKDFAIGDPGIRVPYAI